MAADKIVRATLQSRQSCLPLCDTLEFTLKISQQSLVHHVVHDRTRGVVGAGSFAGGGGGFGVVGGQQILEHFAREFGVECDFLIQRRRFGDGEVVAVEDVDQAAHSGALVFGFAVGRRKINRALLAEEEEVRDGKRVFRVVGEAVNADVGPVFFGAIDLVEALEQVAVEERNALDQPQEGLGLGEQVFVAVEIGYAAVRVAPVGVFVAFAELALANLLVERGEEQVLQDGLLERGPGAGGQVRAVFEKGREGAQIEKVGRDQPHLFHEPAEDQPGDEPNEALCNVSVSVFSPLGMGKTTCLAAQKYQLAISW